MLELDLAPLVELALVRPADESAQKSRVGFLRIWRLAAFAAQILQEVVYERVHSYDCLPVSLVYASRYFACVFSTTSGGSAGAGGVLFQSSVSK